MSVNVAFIDSLLHYFSPLYITHITKYSEYQYRIRRCDVATTTVATLHHIRSLYAAAECLNS
jgi:hypothetical protein